MTRTITGSRSDGLSANCRGLACLDCPGHRLLGSALGHLSIGKHCTQRALQRTDLLLRKHAKSDGARCGTTHAVHDSSVSRSLLTLRFFTHSFLRGRPAANFACG
jgi:hypothetical protein